MADIKYYCSYCKKFTSKKYSGRCSYCNSEYKPEFGNSFLYYQQHCNDSDFREKERNFEVLHNEKKEKALAKKKETETNKKGVSLGRVRIKVGDMFKVRFKMYASGLVHNRTMVVHEDRFEFWSEDKKSCVSAFFIKDDSQETKSMYSSGSLIIFLIKYKLRGSIEYFCQMDTEEEARELVEFYSKKSGIPINADGVVVNKSSGSHTNKIMVCLGILFVVIFFTCCLGNVGGGSSSSGNGGCQYVYSDGKRCGNRCDPGKTMCDYHINELSEAYNAANDRYDTLTGK